MGIVEGLSLAVVAGVVVQIIKQTKKVSKDWLPIVSIIAGGIVGVLWTLYAGGELNMAVVEGAVAGLIASGGYDTIKGVVKMVNK